MLPQHSRDLLSTSDASVIIFATYFLQKWIFKNLRKTNSTITEPDVKTFFWCDLYWSVKWTLSCPPQWVKWLEIILLCDVISQGWDGGVGAEAEKVFLSQDKPSLAAGAVGGESQTPSAGGTATTIMHFTVLQVSFHQSPVLSWGSLLPQKPFTLFWSQERALLSASAWERPSTLVCLSFSCSLSQSYTWVKFWHKLSVQVCERALNHEFLACDSTKRQASFAVIFLALLHTRAQTNV